jgi:hypothetical protein
LVPVFSLGLDVSILSLGLGLEVRVRVTSRVGVRVRVGVKVRANHPYPFCVTSHSLLRDPLFIYEITPLPLLTFVIYINLLSLILNLSYCVLSTCEVLGSVGEKGENEKEGEKMKK